MSLEGPTILPEGGENTGIENIPADSNLDNVEQAENPQAALNEGEDLDTALVDALREDNARKEAFEQENKQIEEGLRQERDVFLREKGGESSEHSEQEIPREVPVTSVEDETPGSSSEATSEQEAVSSETIEREPASPESVEGAPLNVAEALKNTAEAIVEEKQERIDKALSPEHIASPEYAKTLLDHELKRLNIDPEALAKDEALKDFNNLSDGQKLLVAQNLNQFVFAQAKRGAQDEFEKKVAESGLVGKVGLNVFKNYKMATLRKEHVKSAMSGGLVAHGETFKQLVERAKAGPEVEIDSAGQLNMQYAAHFEKLSNDEKRRVKYFNKVAGDFSRIPEEWNPNLKTATPEQKRTYGEWEEAYKNARKDILELKAKEGSSAEALQYVNGLDTLVKQDQFLNTEQGSKLEDAILAIKDKSAVWQGVKNVITERAGYAALGAGTRVLTVGALGLAATPLLGAAIPLVGAMGASALVGGFIARKRTRAALQEKDAMRRYKEGASGEQNKEWKEKLAQTSKETDGQSLAQYESGADKRREILEGRYLEQGLTVSAEALEDKLSTTFARFEAEQDPQKKAKLLASLRARIGYTQDKIEKGEIRYGNSKDQLGNQLDLVQTLARAQVYSAHEDPQVKEILEGKVERLTGYEKHLRSRVADVEQKQIRKAGIKGGLIAATAAVAGYGIAHYFVTRGGSVAEVADAPKGAEAPKLSLGGADEEVFKVSAEEASSRVYDVSPGDNLWNMIEHDLKGELKGLDGHERDVVINNMLDKFRTFSPEQLRAIGFKFQEGETDVEKILDTIHPGDRINFGKAFNSSDLNEALGQTRSIALEDEMSQVHSTVKPPVLAEEAVAGAEPTGDELLPSTPRTIPSEPRGNGAVFSEQQIESSRPGSGGRFEQVAYTTGSPKEIAQIPASDFERGVILSELNGDINVLVPGGSQGENWMYVRGESVDRLMNTRLRAPRAGYVPQQRSPWTVRGGVRIGFGKHGPSDSGSIRIEHRPVPPPRVYRGPLPIGLRSPETVANLQSYISALQEQTGLKWKGSGYSVQEYIFHANKVAGRMNNIPGFGDNPLPEAGALRGRGGASGEVAGSARGGKYYEGPTTPSPFKGAPVQEILNAPVGEEEGKKIMESVASEVNHIFETNGAPKEGFDYGEGIGDASAHWNDMKGRTIDEILRAPAPKRGEEGIGIQSYEILSKVRSELLPKLEHQSGLPANGETTLEDYIKDAHVLIERGPDFKASGE